MTVCVFRRLSDGSFGYWLLHVDDMLIASKSMSEINKTKSDLNGKLELKDLGATKKILDIKISRIKKARRLYLFHKNYLEKVLELFRMQNTKPVTTPLDAHFKLSVELSPQTRDEKYMSLTETIKEALWLRGLLSELGFLIFSSPASHSSSSPPNQSSI